VKIKCIPYPSSSLSSFLRESAWEGKGLGLYPVEGVTANAAQVKERVQGHFDLLQRQTLQQVLREQLGEPIGALQRTNIDLLTEPNAFTVVTGQQIHIGLGPAYVLYKIASTIHWANQLKLQYPKDHFIPVFWMASEDHDVAEIDHVNLNQDRYQWDLPWSTSVGDMPTASLSGLFDWLTDKLGKTPQALERIEQVRAYYLKPQATLASATAQWVSELFAEFGLLVLDPRDVRLKKQARILFEQALFTQALHHTLQNATKALKEAKQTPPAHVGTSLVFWVDGERRSRIEPTKEGFQTADGALHWSKEDMREILQGDGIAHLSANVLLRPLYQQCILPCVAYVAGPSEYLYWLQTAQAFEQANLSAPQLLHRKGGVVLTPSQQKKIDRLGIQVQDCFLGVEGVKDLVVKRLVGENAVLKTVDTVTATLREQLQVLYQWKSPGLSESKKEIDAFLKWQKKLGKAATEAYLESQFSADAWQSTAQLIESQFSSAHPQERSLFWIQHWILYGDGWISAVCSCEDYRMDASFSVVEL